MNNDRERTRNTFDASASQYDRVRPSYPDELIDEAINLSKISNGGRILEIGCGTGKATELFAAKGYSMDCLDVGNDLASIATAKFKDFDNVRIIVNSFEDWDPREASYDMVIAAASIHWVNPQVRFTKSASVLRQSGALAVFANRHIRKEEGFFVRVQDVYRSHAPSMKLIAADRKKLWQESVTGEELFNEPVVRRCPWVAEYDAEDYITLLGTYSDHLSLPEIERASLFARIKELIRDEFSGSIRKHYEAVLTLRSINEGPNQSLQGM